MGSKRGAGARSLRNQPPRKRTRTDCAADSVKNQPEVPHSSQESGPPSSPIEQPVGFQIPPQLDALIADIVASKVKDAMEKLEHQEDSIKRFSKLVKTQDDAIKKLEQENKAQKSILHNHQSILDDRQSVLGDHQSILEGLQATIDVQDAALYNLNEATVSHSLALNSQREAIEAQKENIYTQNEVIGVLNLFTEAQANVINPQKSTISQLSTANTELFHKADNLQKAGETLNARLEEVQSEIEKALDYRIDELEANTSAHLEARKNEMLELKSKLDTTLDAIEAMFEKQDDKFEQFEAMFEKYNDKLERHKVSIYAHEDALNRHRDRLLKLENVVNRMRTAFGEMAGDNSPAQDAAHAMSLMRAAIARGLDDELRTFKGTMKDREDCYTFEPHMPPGTVRYTVTIDGQTDTFQASSDVRSSHVFLFVENGPLKFTEIFLWDLPIDFPEDQARAFGVEKRDDGKWWSKVKEKDQGDIQEEDEQAETQEEETQEEDEQ
ncbi:hypothetical protein B0H63DRAFT_521319 [Podospora didyma]|uniref:Uncharacterized protein n=1 Tax=Podospora didyma TaxID=330526 RepID=A0AAE0NT58_9PEZI|nr:hypothetical protein B0H63DRAFT_521319 [Podospora didyma]